MRYFLQIATMLGDLAVLGASVVALYGSLKSPAMAGVMALIIYLALCEWMRMGGFEAWKPKTIRAFMRNAEKMGL